MQGSIPEHEPEALAAACPPARNPNRLILMKNTKRQFSKVNGMVVLLSIDREYNTFRKVSHSVSGFIKCPVNISDSLRDKSDRKAWKDFKLYVRYLDLKVQNPDFGTFQICHSARYYQRLIKQLIAKGWAWKEGKTIFLKAYQYVWRDMGINRVEYKGHLKYKYWKIPTDGFSLERKVYLREIEDEIRKRISKRKLAQMRYALKANGEVTDKATFSAKSAGSLFGYKSPSTGSKLRKHYFSVVEVPAEQAKPRYNRDRGRYEEPTKQIAI